MTKLYMVVAHNLNQARKARDGNKKSRTIKEPEKLKIGNNILVGDHMSKAFPTKVQRFLHNRTSRPEQGRSERQSWTHNQSTPQRCEKIPMMEKICQLYEKEQVGKVREGRKAVPDNKIPEIGWNIAEKHIQNKSRCQEDTQTNSQQTSHTLQAMIAIAILISTLLEHIKIYIQEIPPVARNIAQTAKTAITKIYHTGFMQNIRESYKMAKLVVTIATSMTSRTSRTIPQQTNNNSKQKHSGTQKLNNQHDGSYRSHMPRTHIKYYNH